MLEEVIGNIVKKAVKDALSESMVHSSIVPQNDNDVIRGIINLSIYMSVSYATAYKLVAKGDIKGFRVGKNHRFYKSDVDEYMRIKGGQDSI